MIHNKNVLYIINLFQEPDYCKVVKYPMFLDMIAYKLRQAKYETLDEFVSDMRRVFWNTRLYYKVNICLAHHKKRQDIEKLFHNNGSLLHRKISDLIH